MQTLPLYTSTVYGHTHIVCTLCLHIYVPKKWESFKGLIIMKKAETKTIITKKS